jgi:hypothetical protein
MISRRSFLLGIGSLVTTAFAAKAKAHAIVAQSPLLLDPGRAQETLYLYEGFDCSDGPDGTKWRVSLGPDRCPAPPPPTWREYLKPQGYAFETQADFDRAYRDMSLLPEEVDQPLDGYAWEDAWEYAESPQAKAFVLLKELKLDCGLNRSGEKAGRIVFTERGSHPGSSEGWVDLRDDLTASLLQARIIERELPIRLRIGELI